MEVKEGKIKIDIKEEKKISAKMPVFYNPKKQFDRNITLEILKIFEKNKKELVFCDLLSASGIRALRFSSELDNVKEIYAIDHNPIAFNKIKENIKSNKKAVKHKIIPIKEKAEKALYDIGKRFDYIDVDPFGSPNPFIDSSLNHIRNKNALIAFTSTDSSALVGTYPKTTLYEYQSKVSKTPFYHEAGIRILAKKIIERAAEKEIALTPIFAYAKDDYFRIFFETDRGANRCLKLLSDFKYYLYCRKCMNTKVISFEEIEKFCTCKNKFSVVGPVFAGNLWDLKYLKKMEKSEFLKKIEEEAEINVPYYLHLPSYFKMKKQTIPKMDNIIADFKKQGFIVSRTHFDNNSIKLKKI